MRREFVELDYVSDNHIQLLRQRGSLDSLRNFGLGWNVLVEGLESITAGYLPPSWDQVQLKKQQVLADTHKTSRPSISPRIYLAYLL